MLTPKTIPGSGQDPGIAIVAIVGGKGTRFEKKYQSSDSASRESASTARTTCLET